LLVLIMFCNFGKKFLEMKTIKLKVYKENIQGKDMFLTTYDLLKSAVNQPTQEGFSVEDMKKRIRLLSVLDKHKSMFEIAEKDFNDDKLNLEADLEIEDADYEILKGLFKEMKWGAVSQSILEIHDSLV